MTYIHVLACGFPLETASLPNEAQFEVLLGRCGYLKAADTVIPDEQTFHTMFIINVLHAGTHKELQRAPLLGSQSWDPIVAPLTYYCPLHRKL